MSGIDGAMVAPAASSLPRPAWAAVAALAFVGLWLRIAAAHGGLWTDEAWSMAYAIEARDAIGVFLRINHDNNHHLNTLWLQFVGPNADPVLARALSIAAGTLAVPVAAVIGARRGGVVAAIASAAAFAVAPIMVVYGSEARGYGLLILAVPLAILLVDRWLDDPAARPPAFALALVTIFGLLSHLTMIVAIALLALWTYVALRPRSGPRGAAIATLRLWLPAFGVALVLLAFIVIAALASATGPRIGGHVPFTLAGLGEALGLLTAFTLGPAFVPAWIGPVLVGLGVLALDQLGGLGPRRYFYLVTILLLPALVALVRPGNAEFARYFLVVAIGLLLLAADLAARGWAKGGIVRAASALLLAAMLATGLWRDAAAIDMRRGDPDDAIRAMAARAPDGARVQLVVERQTAVYRLSAARLRYPLLIARGCAPADFWLVPLERPTPDRRLRDGCGRPWILVGARRVTGLSGDSWALYAPQALQRSQAPVSGPPPIG